jgi:hypothetical protein
MKILTIGLAMTALMSSQAALTCTKDGSEGFLPANSLSIPVGDKSAGGLTEVQFNSVIDEVEKLYLPIVKT